MQQTLVLVKPDGVKKNLIGEIIARFERRGLKVSALKLVKITEEQAKYHYAEHEGKPFFGELKNPLHAKSKISLKLKKFINLKFSGRMVTK